jgi:hypothetical protein
MPLCSRDLGDAGGRHEATARASEQRFGAEARLDADAVPDSGN